MTLDNYERLVDRGVIDPNNDYVCYPAAFDQISLYADVHPQTYIAYNNFYRWTFEEIDASREGALYRHRWVELERQVQADLGLATNKNCHYECCRSSEELERVLVKNRGWRIVISTHGPHSVGVLPNGSVWRAVSTHVPFEDPDHVTIEEMFEELFFDVRYSSRNRRKTERDPNVWIYPPG